MAITREQIRHERAGILSAPPASGTLWDTYVNDGGGALPAGIYQLVSTGPNVWKMLKNLTFGVLSVAPVAGMSLGDSYYDDGLGANPEGLNIYTTTGWTTLTGGVASIDVNSSGTPLIGAVNLADGTTVKFTKAGQTVTATSVAGEKQKPDKYHDVTTMLDDANNGHPGQRCIARDSLGRNLILWHNGVAPPGAAILYLTVENNPDPTATVRQRASITYELTITDQATGLAILPNLQDFCLAVDNQGPAEMIHILGTFLTNAGTQDIFDAYFAATTIPVDPVPAAITPLALSAEMVNQLTNLLNPCTNPSACAVPGAQYSLAVTFVQLNNATGFTEVIVTKYDYTAAAWGRYITFAATIISDPSTSAIYPTVECIETNICIAFVQDSGAGVNALYFSYSTTAGAPWSTTPLANPIDSFGALTGDFQNAPSMVLVNDVDNTWITATIAIQDMAGGANNVIYAYQFTLDITLGVAPTVFNECAVDVYDNFRTENHFRCMFQLGVSVNQYDSTANQYPVFYLLKCMTTLLDNYDLMLAVGSYPIDTYEPWIHIPVQCGIGDIVGGGGGAVAYGFRPKVHYAGYDANRPARVFEQAWYPAAVGLRMETGWQVGVQPSLPMNVMVSKDIPAYPLTVS